ncbi:hypothetical protein [Paraburkholderia sp. BL10I2N1]|uniref:hypothetical protein n=1 Tax=Paraburkholderia sp. BL10I2N1 TaxID=1938796 RepID=UPI0010619B05|nr:hypothetical protein [Paraburkholderia sp. BL10I2N1]TDN70475.1 hypothetical protein B0G77_3949 [Paraburkholderia sp. BL10I2N1]
MKYDLERARLAVEYLISTQYFPQRVKGLRHAVRKPRALPYSGEAEPLNELLVIGRQNEQAMENLISVAQYKRGAQSRGEYQRRFMKQQRDRWAKAVQLEERLFGKKLSLDERNILTREVQATWMEERDAYIEMRAAQQKIQFGTDASFEDRHMFIDQFWDRKDKELDAMLNESPAQSHHIRRKKRTVVVKENNKDGAMQQAFKKLIDRPK